MRLCADCQTVTDKWMFNTSPLTHSGRGLRIASGAAYDDTPAGVSTNRRHRVADWKHLVNTQIRAIRDICARTHQPGQVALFDIAA